MTKRDELAAWLADMPEDDIEALWSVARRLRVTMAPAADPELAGLPDWLVNAPMDTEPLSDEFMAKLAKVDEGIRKGEPGIPADLVWGELLG